MGGTLDNGIYLPDQGERNCYNGLKNNWDTLDNLIETVQALSSAGLTREIVNSLPTENIKTNVIYMLRNSQQSGDLYDEYMYINNAWEPIGTSATEMDNYYTKAETNSLPAIASGITASKVTGYDSHVANTEIHITAAERSTWNSKQNALDTDQTAAVNSGITGTKVTGYDTHVADMVIHVTSSDKTAWNAKQDGLSQTQLNAVNSGVTGTKVTGYDTHVADSSAHVSSADRASWNGKQDALSQTQLNNIAAVPDKANSADLATVATTGDYGDLLNAPTIPTVNNATLIIQKNGTDVATFTANASSNVTANLSIPTDTSDLTNGAGFLTQHNPIDNELSVSSENAVQNKVVTAALNGKAASSHTHAAGDINTGTFNIARIPDLDASKITSGTIDIARLPKGSLERLVKVADQAARFALTTDDVQLGDTVQQLDTGVMYAVTDVTKLDSADGYTEFTAGSATSVPWSGVTGKPSSFTPSSHTHGNISNDGKVGTTANVPLITGAGGVVQAGSFGTTSGTFCEGNDSRLSDARTPVAHTHSKNDITDLLNSDFIPSANDAYELGSSSYQWKSVYAQNYYYKGVACGDILTHNVSEFVNVSGNQTVGGIKTFSNEVTMFGRDINLMSRTHYGKNSNPSATSWHYLFFRGNTATEGYTNSWHSGYLEQVVNTNGSARGRWFIRDTSENPVCIELFVNGSNKHVSPAENNAVDLGTSTNKWKSFNGVNPGALSLPSGGTTENTDWFNVAGDILPTGGNATSFSRETANYFTPAKDGWLALAVKNCSEISVWCESLKYGISIVVPNASVNRQTVIPVVAGKSYQILITGNSWTSARLIMPQGNV